MSESEQNQIKRGTRGQFHWLLAYELSLSDILNVCPEVVVGRHIAITDWDNGPLRELREPEQDAGWELRNDVAYSPKIAKAADLDDFCIDCYDEWYVLASPGDLGKRIQQPKVSQANPKRGEVIPFVNYHDLGLDLAEDLVASLFWLQMNWINPEVYLSDNQSWLTVVSADATLIESVSQKLAALK